MDELTEADPEDRPKRHVGSQVIPGVNTLHTPVKFRFDPPLEPRPYEEIYAEVTAAMKAIEKRRYGRKKAK